MNRFALNILFVGNCSEDSVDLLQYIRQQGHELTVVNGLDKAIQTLTYQVPHFILLKASCLVDVSDQLVSDLQRLTHQRQPAFLLLCDGGQVTSLPFVLNRGGGDFMCQPYKLEYLALKLDRAVKRFEHELSQVSKKSEHNQLNSGLSLDREIATTLYNNIAKFNNLYDSALSYLSHSNGLFKRDILLSAKKPDGGLHVFLGRFSCYSFSAVFAAFSMADAFFEMTAKGFSAAKVLMKMNDRLKSSLPDSIYLSGALVDLRHHEGCAEVWNAGLPDVVLMDSATHTVTNIAANSQFLGTQESGDLIVNLAVAPLSENVRIGMQSRHLSAGFPTLEELVLSGEEGMSQLNKQSLQQEDDYTYLAIDLSCLYQNNATLSTNQLAVSDVAGGFSFEYELNARSLKTIDPLPYVLQVITAEPSLSKCSGQVFMILSELYSNALEHGVLRLKSDKKSTPEGFVRYYEDRQKALDNLTEGFVRIKARVCILQSQSVLQITVEDSGNGFDTESVIFDIPTTEVFYNRGFALLNQLCQRIEFSQGGRSVTASYQLEC